jgi:peptide/nickel transport system permease protein
VEEKLTLDLNSEHRSMGRTRTAWRVLKFSAARALTIALALMVGLFIAVFFVNQGGFIDEIYKDSIEWILFGARNSFPDDYTYDQIVEAMDAMRVELYHTYGLDRPFLERCLEWWKKSITLDWGEVYTVYTPRNVRSLVGESLAYSMLLFGAGAFLTFFLTIGAALIVSRHFGTWLDKLIIVLAPISTAPNWLYGIILVAIFSIQLEWLPDSGMFEYTFGEISGDKFNSLVEHSILPVLAIFLSMFIQGVYAWRTFFIKSLNADHLDLAKAMGLSQRRIERKHILRPTMPYIITNLSMMLLGFWQGIIALEVFFDWPGIGLLFLRSFARVQNDVSMGVIVIFAYMMGITVFSLDFVYALIDPRVRINAPNQPHRLKKKRWEFSWLKKKSNRLSLSLAQVETSRDTSKLQQKSKKPLISEMLRARLIELKKFPTAIAGLAIILALVIISVYTVIEVPQEQAIEMWRGERFDTYKVPELAEPTWFNWFRKGNQPETLILSTSNGDSVRTQEPLSETAYKIIDEFSIEYPYTGFPQDIKIKLNIRYETKQPLVIITWVTPDGREIGIDQFSTTADKLYSIFHKQRGGLTSGSTSYGDNPMHYLFQNPGTAELVALEGEYILRIETLLYEEGADANIEVAMLGQVYGLAGTDVQARDLGIGLLWGLQVALIFGLVGAILTSITTMLIAAAGAWFGGWLDRGIQMLTEINMVLPVIAIAVTVAHIYQITVWTIMAIVILFSIFSNNIKNYRSVFLQVKESPYIEAAQAYGTSNWRMIRRYLIPEILPLLSVPSFVYIESTLAFLGVTGFYLPSLGKIISQAFQSPYLAGKMFWILEPTVLLLLIGFGFSMLGIALDRILNPTLQER